MQKIVLSSGHGKYIRGAAGPAPWGLDEVDEARKVVNRVASYLNNISVGVEVFHDDVSQNQDANLKTICAFHNNRTRDLDVSVHFNCYDETASGTETLYVTQKDLAKRVTDKICAAGGFKNRGSKYRDDLYFLNHTSAPAILIETCFCDSHGDADLYRGNFEAICAAISEALSGILQPPTTDGEPAPEPPGGAALFSATGKASYFGGPEDEGVSPSEGLAFISNIEAAPHLFLPYQPSGTTGLARRLNPYVSYIACRWNYDKTPKPMLLEHVALVHATKTGIRLRAFPADFGPHPDTNRVADLSPSLMENLGIKTDDECEIIFPWKG